MSETQIEFQVNGESHKVKVHPFARLLDVLREKLKLTGTKEGCGEGECGACSIFVDGILVNSCLIPAIQVHGANIETIEGLSQKQNLSAIQQAFIDYGGAQCGICTPGMIMASMNILQSYEEKPTPQQIREGLAGNFCRCTGYTKIIEAVESVYDKKEQQ